VKLYIYLIFPIQNILKQGDAFLALLFNFALKYTVRKVQVNRVRLKLNETYQLLACADDVHLFRDNIAIIKEITDTLIDAGKEAGLEVKVEELSICCCLVTRMQAKIGT
jgi:hypothetical protein